MQTGSGNISFLDSDRAQADMYWLSVVMIYIPIMDSETIDNVIHAVGMYAVLNASISFFQITKVKDILIRSSQFHGWTIWPKANKSFTVKSVTFKRFLTLYCLSLRMRVVWRHKANIGLEPVLFDSMFSHNIYSLFVRVHFIWKWISDPKF